MSGRAQPWIVCGRHVACARARDEIGVGRDLVVLRMPGARFELIEREGSPRLPLGGVVQRYECLLPPGGEHIWGRRRRRQRTRKRLGRGLGHCLLRLLPPCLLIRVGRGRPCSSAAAAASPTDGARRGLCARRSG